MYPSATHYTTAPHNYTTVPHEDQVSSRVPKRKVSDSSKSLITKICASNTLLCQVNEFYQAAGSYLSCEQQVEIFPITRIISRVLSRFITILWRYLVLYQRHMEVLLKDGLQRVLYDRRIFMTLHLNNWVYIGTCSIDYTDSRFRFCHSYLKTIKV